MLELTQQHHARAIGTRWSRPRPARPRIDPRGARRTPEETSDGTGPRTAATGASSTNHRSSAVRARSEAGCARRRQVEQTWTGASPPAAPPGSDPSRAEWWNARSCEILIAATYLQHRLSVGAISPAGRLTASPIACDVQHTPCATAGGVERRQGACRTCRRVLLTVRALSRTCRTWARTSGSPRRGGRRPARAPEPYRGSRAGSRPHTCPAPVHGGGAPAPRARRNRRTCRA